jgi:TetR/AcrR family transcriptional regulator, regulator of mycofactocin system
VPKLADRPDHPDGPDRPDRPDRLTGRPAATSRDELARVALTLFAEHGFAATSLQRIADAAGVSRRTVLRYYASKNDIVWGAFDEHLQGLRERLAAADPAEPMLDTIRREVVIFNDYGAEELPALRARMTLITAVPALQGHSMLRYVDWCAVIAEFVAGRLGVRPGDHVPRLVADLALSVAISAYRHWIADPRVDLIGELDRGFRLLGTGLADGALSAAAAG